MTAKNRRRADLSPWHQRRDPEGLERVGGIAGFGLVANVHFAFADEREADVRQHANVGLANLSTNE